MPQLWIDPGGMCRKHSAKNARKTHFHRKDYWKVDEPWLEGIHVVGKALCLCEL